MEIKLHGEEFRDVAEKALNVAIERSGLVAAIREAAAARLALTGAIDKEQAAEYFGITVRTIEGWMKPVADGGLGLPHLKFGTAVRFKIASLESWSAQYEINRVLQRVA